MNIGRVLLLRHRYDFAVVENIYKWIVLALSSQQCFKHIAGQALPRLCGQGAIILSYNTLPEVAHTRKVPARKTLVRTQTARESDRERVFL